MWAVLLALMLLLLPIDAAADPCTGAGDGDFYNGAGSTPSPAAVTAIRMLSETVDFYEAPEGRSWMVKAHYVFENRRDRRVRTSMIFPFDESDRSCTVATSFGMGSTTAHESIIRGEIEGNGFSARLNGKTIPTTFRKGVACSGGLEYPYGYFFVTEFEPQTKVTLDIEYKQIAGPAFMSPGVGCACYGLDFILETGALWEGPIGEILFRYHLATPTAFFKLDQGWPDARDECGIPRFQPGKVKVSGIDFQADFTCSENAALLTLMARDVEPTGDVSFLVHDPDLRIRTLKGQGCPFIGKSKTPARDCCPNLSKSIPPGNPDDYLDPFTFCVIENESPSKVLDGGVVQDAALSTDADTSRDSGASRDSDPDRTPRPVVAEAGTSTTSEHVDGGQGPAAKVKGSEGQQRKRAPSEPPVAVVQQPSATSSSSCGCSAAGGGSTAIGSSRLLLL